MDVRIRPSARLREGYCSRPVCLSVCLSVPALAASASVETSNQRYPLVSLRLFLEFEDFRKKLPFKSYGVGFSWILRIFEKNFHSKVMV